MLSTQKHIDFHAHILPGVDHGCADAQMCQKQLALAKKYNIQTIVATPHFYPHLHTVDSFLALRERGMEKIDAYAKQYGIDVIKGAEVQLCIGLDKMQGIERLCIGNTNVLLMEIPDMPLVFEMYETIRRLSQTVTVLIAHADRYATKITDKLIEENYKMQLNAPSIVQFGTRKRVQKLLRSGLVCALGSDIHGIDVVPYRCMQKAQKILKEQYVQIQTRMHDLLGW